MDGGQCDFWLSQSSVDPLVDCTLRLMLLHKRANKDLWFCTHSFDYVFVVWLEVFFFFVPCFVGLFLVVIWDLGRSKFWVLMVFSWFEGGIMWFSCVRISLTYWVLFLSGQFWGFCLWNLMNGIVLHSDLKISLMSLSFDIMSYNCIVF